MTKDQPTMVERVARAMAPTAWLPFSPDMHGSPMNRASAQEAWLSFATSAINAMLSEDVVAWAEMDGDEWLIHDAKGTLGDHIRLHQTNWHYKTLFPVYATPLRNASQTKEPEQ